MKKILVAMCLALCGCGSDDPKPYMVNIHYIPKPEVQTMAVKSNPGIIHDVYGVTYKLEASCEIYMISEEASIGVVYNYMNEDGTITVLRDRLFWEWLLGHENKHCILGNFHD